MYRTLPRSEEEGGHVESRCVDCSTRLDRFGLDPIVHEQTIRDLEGIGYEDLDRPVPVGLGGCFSTRGCEGCPKIETRPW